MENLNIITNWVNRFDKEFFESMEYKIASNFDKEDLQFDGTQKQFENLKDQAFYMACEIVHIKYELGQMKDFLNIVQKYK